MSFSYNMTLSTNEDKLRLLLADTVAASAIWTNEELTGVLTMEPNVYMAGALLARSRAAATIPGAWSYTVAAGVRTSLAVDRRRKPEFWLMLAKALEAKAFSVADELFDVFDFVIDVYGRDVSEYQGRVRVPGLVIDGLL